MKVKGVEISTKHLQIQKASSTVFATVAIASVVVSFCLVFLNILWGTAQFNSRVHDKQEDVRDLLEDNLKAAPELEESFKNLEISASLIPEQPDDKKNSEIILDALPSKFDFPALVSSINNLAKETSVSLRSFQGTDVGEEAAQSSNRPEPVEIPFIIEVEGKYEAVKKFLRGIETSIRPFEVKKLNLSGTDGNMRVNVEAVTYYQPAFNLEVTTEVVE